MLHDAIKVGPFLIQNYYFVIFISSFIAYIMIRNRLKSSTELRAFLINKLSNGLILYLLSWKFSFVLFSFSTFVNNPQSILFYTGGQKGVILATILSLLYLLFTLRNAPYDRKLIGDALLIGLFSFFISYFTLFLFIGYEIIPSFMKLLVFIALYLFYVKRRKIGVHKEEHERKEVMKKGLILIVFIGLIGYTIYSAAFHEESNVVGLDKGNLSPDFQLVNVDGEQVKLSDYRGKKILLNFWASWCGPCRVEMPDMQELHDERREDLVILAVNATQSETSIENPKQFMDELGLTFPIVFDEKGAVSKMYQVVALPTTYFINSEGKIMDKHTGTLSYEQMVQKISKLD